MYARHANNFKSANIDLRHSGWTHIPKDEPIILHPSQKKLESLRASIPVVIKKRSKFQK